MKRKLLAWVLTLAMIISVMPVAAFAAPGDGRGLPIYFFVAEPGSTPTPTSTYEAYPLVAQGSAIATAEAGTNNRIATKDGIRNVNIESTITDYVASWPTGYDAESFKEFGTIKLFNQTYSHDEYEITWVSICKRTGYGIGDLNCWCNDISGDHIHIDGILSKKIKPASMDLVKRIPEAQSTDETFSFTLQKLMQDEDYDPTTQIDASFGEIEMKATIKAGETTGDIVPVNSNVEIGFGYYKLTEEDSAKWHFDPVYIQVATDGSLRWSTSYNRDYQRVSNNIVVQNKYETYTVTYDPGVVANAFKPEVYTDLDYGVGTPDFTGGTPEDHNDEKVFTGWSPKIAETVTENVTYVAQWETKYYTVTWLDEDGDVLEIDRNVPNKTKPEYNGETPTKAGNDQYSYEFVGWTPAVTEVNGADQEYTAVYQPVVNEYTVTWENDDGTELEVDQNVAYGTLPTYNNGGGTIVQLAADKNTAQYTYRFAGWDPSVSAVTGDITYTATYTRTTKQYTVTWIDHDGTELDEDTVDYGTRPVYTGTEPSRSDTAYHTYTFAGWKNDAGTDNKVYVSGDTFPVVTKDVTYRAQYNAADRLYTVTLKLYLDGELTNSADVHGEALVPKLRTSSTSEAEYVCQLTDATGVYQNTAVPNGTYRIYVGDETTPICDQIIVVENDDVEKVCYYYTVSYNANGGTGAPAVTKHHQGTAASVSEKEPTYEGHIFKGWKIEDDTRVAQPGEKLTDHITQKYALVAQWVKTVDVYVNVEIDHTSGHHVDEESTKDEVTIELVWKPGENSTTPWDEVDNTILNLHSGTDSHKYSFSPTAANDEEDYRTSTYTAEKATYTGLEGGNRVYTVTATKPGYEVVSITPVQRADGDWTVHVKLKYAPSDFELEFSVSMASDVPKSAYPDAVIARVLRWNAFSRSWQIISQQDGGQPGVRVNIDHETGAGSGTYTVVADAYGHQHYDYRFEISAFVYDDQVVPATTPHTGADHLVVYTDGTYTGTMQDVLNPNNEWHTHNGREGAYYANHAQVGTLHAVITVPVHQITIDGNGGTFGESAIVTLDNLLKMPAISGYIPTRTDGAYTFDGYDWYIDEDADGVVDPGGAATNPVATGAKLTDSYVLVAKWKAPWTVLGTVYVDGTYELDGETKVIEDADRIKQVTVLLQYAYSGSTNFVNRDSKTVAITYGENGIGTGSYEFANIANDGGIWRVQVLNHNYSDTYRNETATDFVAVSADSDANYAVDKNSDNEAQVDVKMAFSPENFDLHYKVIADAIGEGLRPTSAEVLVLYDATANSSESPRNWPVISQMQGYTGDTGDVGEEHSYPVWKYHPDGHLYDYAIKVQAVDKTKPLTGDEPYTIEYNGTAEYVQKQSGPQQTLLLTATLKPKAYPVKYYLEQDSTIELTSMQGGAIKVSRHTWSFDTALQNADGSWKDVPTRVGYTFAGWTDAQGKPVTAIEAEVAAETKLYATWATDNWADADADPNDNVTTDSRTGGDGIPDSQQICIAYTTDSHGSVSPLFEIVTISSDDYSDVTVSGSGSAATALPGYAYDRWEYIGSAADENDQAEFTVADTTHELSPTISNADGGKTYTFEAFFDVDVKGGDNGGDGIPDKYQAFVEFRSANANHGTVEGNIHQTFNFGAGTTSGTVEPSLEGVAVNPANEWAFDHWIKDNETEKLDKNGVETPIEDVAGGTTITFYANFAIDEWKDADETDDPDDIDTPNGGDGIPDYQQVLVTFIASANNRGTVTGEGAVQVFTLSSEDNYIGSVTPVKTNLIVAGNEGYAFDYWEDLEGFWVDPEVNNGRVPEDKVFSEHKMDRNKEPVKGGDIITYVAHFAEDQWKDSDKTEDPEDTDSPEGGDGIPDKYQTIVTYKVIENNGTWSDNTTADIIKVFTLKEQDEDGVWKEIAVVLGDTIPTGMKAAEAFLQSSGEWDVAIDGETPVTGMATYTYEFKTAKMPSVKITKEANKATVYVGEKVTYTITVENNGNTDLTNVVVEDTFTSGGKGKISFTNTNAVKLEDGRFIIGALAKGQTVKFSYTYTTVSEDVRGLVNKATVKSNETADTDSTEDVTVRHEPLTPVGPSRPKLNMEDHYAYVVGYPDGLVHPERNITRAEVSTIFFRMLLDESREYFWAQENTFTDVPADKWFNNAVSTLANANLITGYPDGSFKPNNNITRAEFATIAIRFFLEEDVEIEENNLTDVKGHWAEANIDLAYALGLITGYPDGTFRPNQLITRAEAMTIVNRVLKRAPHKDYLLEDMIQWPDNLNKNAWYYADVQEATNSHEFHMNKENEYEIWTELLPVRDWAALEREWSEHNSSKNPGEVVDINISTPEAEDKN